MELKIIYLNEIQNDIFQLHSKSYIEMELNIIYLNEVQNDIFQLHSKSYN